MTINRNVIEAGMALDISTMEVTQSRTLADAKYTLSKDEQQILLLISQRSGDPDTQNNEGWYEVKVSDYAQVYKISKHEASRDIREAISKLYERSIVIVRTTPEGDEEEIKIRWISRVSRRPKYGKYGIYFTEELKPYIHQLHNTIKYPLVDVIDMRKTESRRIYEWVYDARETGELYLELEYIRSRLELGGTYSQYADLKRRILNPTVKSINDVSPLTIKMSEVKEGRKVIGVNFNIAMKEEHSVAEEVKE